ncbi:MAG TPA: hypothetical protein VIF57_12030 [Polyangia bacterium]|jgi:hypothetical protein
MRSLWSRCCAIVPALGLVVAVALHAPRARADGSERPPAATDRVVKIGPQATVVVNEHGDVRMYDDPAEHAPDCKSPADCWGKALGVFGLFFAATYEEMTTNVEGGTGSLQSGLPAEE